MAAARWLGGGVLTGGADGVARLWTAPEQAPRTFPLGAAIAAVHLSAEGDQAAIATVDQAICLVDLTTNGTRSIRPEPPRPITRLATSSDGGLVAAGFADGSVGVWDTATGELARALGGHRGSISTVSFHPDGHLLACGDTAGNVRLWDLATAQEMAFPQTLTGEVTSLRFSHDGRFLAATTSAGTVCLWRVAPGARREVLAGHDGPATAVCFHPDEPLLASAGRDGAIRLWDRATGAARGALATGPETAKEIAFAPEARAVSWLGRPVGGRGTWTAKSARLDGSGEVREWSLGPAIAGSIAEGGDTIDRMLPASVRRVRRAHCRNRHLGICLWFDEFDRCWEHADTAACLSLLQEIAEYPLSAQEGAFVRRRQGAIWLKEGVLLQRQAKYAEARDAYDRACTVKDAPGLQSTVLLAMNLLERQRSTGAADSLLDSVCQDLFSAADGARVLSDRVRPEDAADRALTMSAALELRFAAPLQMMVASGDDATRMMATAAIHRFVKVPDLALLLAALADPHWFVRWRAAERLATEGPEVEISVSPLAEALARETDPEVRRSLARCLGARRDPSATPALIHALADQDPDVRFAVAEALGRAGDRRALGALRTVLPGKSFLGQAVDMASQEAADSIRSRFPLPTAERLDVYRVRPDGSRERTTQLMSRDPFVVAGLMRGAGQADVLLHLRCCDGAGLVVAETSGALRNFVAPPAQVSWAMHDPDVAILTFPGVRLAPRGKEPRRGKYLLTLSVLDPANGELEPQAQVEVHLIG